MNNLPKNAFASMKKSSLNTLAIISISTIIVLGITTQVSAADSVTADPEAALWLTTQKLNTTEGYETYLAQYADGKFASLAKTSINKINTAKLVQAENSEWKVLQDSEDEATVQKFLDKYPKGVNILAVKLKLASIRRIATEYKSGQAFKGCATCPEMVIVPAGSFTMGEGTNAHLVTFKEPFAIGKKEVTQKEWMAVMGTNPSKFKDCIGNCPVDNVSWNDAKEFIRRLNIRTGKEYRLPSEAEWEYSCRSGGLHQKYCGSGAVDSIAWFAAYSTTSKRSDRYSKPVANKKANAWGLFDMSGYVAEWTEDGFHENLIGAPADGSAWRGDGQGYVLRGGSWESNVDQIRATYRDYDGPSNRDVTYGFRIARKFP